MLWDHLFLLPTSMCSEDFACLSLSLSSSSEPPKDPIGLLFYVASPSSCPASFIHPSSHPCSLSAHPSGFLPRICDSGASCQRKSFFKRGLFLFPPPQPGPAVSSLQREPSLPVLHLFQDKTKYSWTTQSSSCVGRDPGNVLGSGCHFMGRGSWQQLPQWAVPGKSTSFGARPTQLGSKIQLGLGAWILGHVSPSTYPHLNRFLSEPE